MRFKTLQHKQYPDMFGTFVENPVELAMCSVPDLLAETATIDGFKELFKEHQSVIDELVTNYSLVVIDLHIVTSEA